jgi:pimeloyl-ACP methyl ester carboxylesterase
MKDAIIPHRIQAPENALIDLEQRLTHTRWPDPETPRDWSQGIPLAYMKEVVRYWASEYDWRRCEDRINSLDPFKTELDGLGIHFLHVRSPREDALPLVMTHGWPGSIIEFMKVVEPLAYPDRHGGDAADAFHVVCPSLPGFGFSEKPTETGWTTQRIARAWAELMKRLGYERYVAQGGDWGSMVTCEIALADPEHCAGIHLNMPVVSPDPETMNDLTPGEQSALEAFQYYQDWDSGYSKQQSTRPQTLGYGLVDSPAGQAAWILEKFWAWTDSDGHPENVLTRDELLDNVLGELQQDQLRPDPHPGRLQHLPQGDLRMLPTLGRETVHPSRSLERTRQGGPLRCLRTARCLRGRVEELLPPHALTEALCKSVAAVLPSG